LFTMCDEEDRGPLHVARRGEGAASVEEAGSTSFYGAGAGPHPPALQGCFFLGL